MTLPGVSLVPFLEWQDLTTSMLTMLMYVNNIIIIIIQGPNTPLHKIALIILYCTAKNFAGQIILFHPTQLLFALQKF